MQGEQVLIIGHSTWARWRQTHEFAIRLARENRVIFVENFSTPADLRWQGMSWPDVFCRLAPQKPLPVNDNLAVLYPPVMLPTGISILSRFWGKEIMRASITSSRPLAARWLRWQLHRAGFHPTVLLIAYPFELLLAGRLGERVSCFYVYDELASMQPESIHAILADEFERRYIGQVDLVFASSRSQYEKRKNLHPNVHCILNAADFERFNTVLGSEAAEPDDLRGIPRPRVGYAGHIAGDYLDFDILERIAASHPEWSLVLIGWVKESARKSLRTLQSRPNVYILGEKPPTEMPMYMKGFEVGVMPYLLTPAILAGYPLKMHEYLALGLPVISTALPEVTPFSETVRIADDSAGFVSLIEDELATNTPEKVAARIAVARENSWEQRVEGMAALIDQVLHVTRKG